MKAVDWPPEGLHTRLLAMGLSDVPRGLQELQEVGVLWCNRSARLRFFSKSTTARISFRRSLGYTATGV
ncbi:hypothetical protein GJAV_G00248220 [Gymnothorax javanicus]|nr:hypothetical protein GJAV_G00248220 [Gymnothorax javanicus]